MYAEALAGMIPPGLTLWFLLVASRRPSEVSVEVEGENLVLRITGRDAFYALCRGMTIPLDCIQGITVVAAQKVPKKGLRWPGLEIPGALRAGSYGLGDRRDFWLVRKAPELLVVELESGEPYRRLILELPDVREQARRIRPGTGVYVGPLTA
jgi:hypothetical protein